MSDKVEGTLTLDGLIEGKLPDDDTVERRLREWVGFAAGVGLRFSLEIDGDAFSLLADNTPVPADTIGENPTDVIAQTLGQLLKVFPGEHRVRVLSTVRSVEYRKGVEVQTLYVVGPDGTVGTRERTLDARTTPPPRKLTAREKWRLAGIGVLIAAVVFLISAIFVNYGDVWRHVVEGVTPFDVDALEVDASAFERFFTVEKKEHRSGARAVVVTLKRTDAWPVKDGVFLDPSKPVKTQRERLTRDALARGYVRCEYFDKDGKFLSCGHHRIAELHKKETTKLVLPLPPRKRLVRVVVTY